MSSLQSIEIENIEKRAVDRYKQRVSEEIVNMMQCLEEVSMENYFNKKSLLLEDLKNFVDVLKMRLRL